MPVLYDARAVEARELADEVPIVGMVPKEHAQR